jgi:hypothetical protein
MAISIDTPVLYPLCRVEWFTIVANCGYFQTYLITYCMEQSPSSEANRFAASQEIPCILLNPKVHYRIPNCSPPVSILSQPSPVHIPKSYFLRIHLHFGLPSVLFPSGFPTKTLYTPLPAPIRVTCCPAHLILLDLITAQ